MLTTRLEATKPAIEKILALSGTVGLCYGILHHGKVVHAANFGFRDYDEKLPVNEETIFPLCSLTKAMVASGLGALVEEGKLSWETKIKDAVPGFKTQSEELNDSASVLDYLSMNTGMQQYGTWLQSHNNIIFPAHDSMKIINSFKQTQPLRHGFQYDNWAYEIAGHVFPNVVGVDWGSFLSTKIFKPLGLERTGTSAGALDSENVARAYAVLDDATPVTVRDVQLSDQTLMGAAGGARSCVSDLLTYYAAFLSALQDQASSGKTSSANVPFAQVLPITTAHAEIQVPVLENQAYCTGWVKGRLPGRFGVLSNNFANLGADVPTIGKSGSNMTTLSHAGSMVGATNSVILFPESNSAIVVLTNTSGLSDTADTVSQLLTEVLFDLPMKHDFVGLTQTIVDAELKSMSKIAQKLRQERTPDTKSRDLRDYTGTYWNATGTMKVAVFIIDHKLAMRFQDLEEETFAMEHYENDTFTWWMSREDCARRGRFTNDGHEYFTICFGANAEMIDRLTWKTGSQSSEPEVFLKSSE